MRVLVLQHIACEPPGVHEDVLRERGGEMLDHGRRMFGSWLDVTLGVPR